jgi:hypothetical protein
VGREGDNAAMWLEFVCRAGKEGGDIIAIVAWLSGAVSASPPARLV